MLVLVDSFSYFSFPLTDRKFLEDVSYTHHQKHNRLSRASYRHARFISNIVSFYLLDFTLAFSQLIMVSSSSHTSKILPLHHLLMYVFISRKSQLPSTFDITSKICLLFPPIFSMALAQLQALNILCLQYYNHLPVSLFNFDVLLIHYHL